MTNVPNPSGGPTDLTMTSTFAVIPATTIGISTNGDGPQFLTAPGVPADVAIPGGSWAVFFHATTTGSPSSVTITPTLSIYNAGITTLINAGNPIALFAGNTQTEYQGSLTVPTTPLVAGDQLLFAFVAGGLTLGDSIAFYLDGDTQASVITSFAVAGNTGPTGPTGANGIGFTGPTGPTGSLGPTGVGVPGVTGATGPAGTPGTSANASTWAVFPAISSVDMSGNSLSNANKLSASSVYASSAGFGGTSVTPLTTISSGGTVASLNSTATQSMTVGQLTGLGNISTYGANRIVGTNALYAEGGTTLTAGGVVHGIEIGALTVAGVDTQRIDVLPAGIGINAATYVQVAAAGAASVAAGGALSLAGGSYIEANTASFRHINTSSGNQQTTVYSGFYDGPYGVSNTYPMVVGNNGTAGTTILNVNSLTGTASNTFAISNVSNIIGIVPGGLGIYNVKEIGNPANSMFLNGVGLLTNPASTMDISGVRTINSRPVFINGQFISTSPQTQTGGVADTPTPILFTSGSPTNGITLGTPASQIVVSKTGLYQFIYSVQLDKTGGGTDLAFIWLRKNGADIPETATQFTLVGPNGEVAPSVPYFLSLVAGDAIEVVFASPDATMTVLAVPASTSPYVRPAIPGIIAVMNLMCV